IPATIFSNVLLPEPFLPMMPSVSPGRSSKLTSSSTRSSRHWRGRKRSSTCCRTVSRRTLGIAKLLVTPSTSTTAIRLHVLGHARREAAIDDDSGGDDHGGSGGQEDVGASRR